MEGLSTAFSNMLGGLAGVIEAILLLIVAFVVSGLIKSLVVRFIEKTKFNAWVMNANASGAGVGNVKEFIGRLVYLLVFLLFVPGIFALLGVRDVAAPVLNLLNIVWGYAPNILAAIIILIVGFKIAGLIRQLLIPVFNRLKVDALQEKAGIQATDGARLSATLAYIIYVLIIIPVIIMALRALGISAISEPAISMLYLIFEFIPNIIIGILLIALGVMIGRLAGQIAERLLAATGVDGMLEKLMEGGTRRFVLSKATGIVVQVVIVIFFCVQGLNILKLDVLTRVGSAIIAYMPRALAAGLIFAAAVIAASMVSRAMKKSGMDKYVPAAKIAIFVLAGFMILNQLNIATQIVNATFILILAAAAVAAAIAFGIGGKDAAADLLKKLSEKK